MKKHTLSLLLVFTMIGSLMPGCADKTSPSVSESSDASSSNSVESSTKTTQIEGSSETTDDQTEISFMGWGTDDEIATFTQMINQYEIQYPNVKVEYIKVADNEFDTKLQTMIGAKECPDVFYCNIDKMMKYASIGNLLDLTDYYADNDIFDQDNIWSCLLNLYRFDGEKQGAGSIYAMPKDISAFPVFYNKDLFKAAGVTPPTQDDPWDWNDYLEAAKKLTTGEGDNKIYGTGSYSLEAAVWSNGAEWVDQETLTKVEITDPQFTEALQWVADLNLVHGVCPSPTEQSALSDYDRFKQGKLAMVGSGTWSLGDFWKNCDFEWDIMPWPVSPNTGKTAIWFGSAGLAVSATTEHPTEASNLCAFLAYNEESQRTAYKMGQAVPTLKDMALGEYTDSGLDPQSKYVIWDMFEKTGRLATQSRTFNQEWFDEFNSNVATVMEGDMTAKEYCESINDNVQQLLDDSIAQQSEYVN
jgi:multiple sugar transport system substrate-binding protein